MAFAYTPFVRDTDKVRFLVGDTDEADPQLQDEEIAFLLTDEGSVNRAAIAAAEAIAAQYARQVDYSVGRELQETLSQRQTHYLQLAERLRRKAARTGVKPAVGGLSYADKTKDQTNPDRPQPFFRRGEETEPGTEPAPIVFPMPPTY